MHGAAPVAVMLCSCLPLYADFTAVSHAIAIYPVAMMELSNTRTASHAVHFTPNSIAVAQFTNFAAM